MKYRDAGADDFFFRSVELVGLNNIGIAWMFQESGSLIVSVGSAAAQENLRDCFIGDKIRRMGKFRKRNIQGNQTAATLQGLQLYGAWQRAYA